MRQLHIPVWKQSPCFRILLAFCAGIICQYYGQFSGLLWKYFLLTNVIGYLLIEFLSLAHHYRLRYLQGCFILFLLAAVAGWLTALQDVRLQATWYGHHVKKNDVLRFQLIEPPVEKEKSFKLLVLAHTILRDKKQLSVTGKCLLYLPKDSSVAKMKYGDGLLISVAPQYVAAPGNPGAFDYRQYLAFQQIYQQVFVKEGQWIQSNPTAKTWRYYLFSFREWVLQTLRQYIPGGPKITGIAEALLIGYKDDLDKELVQQYSQTGVVHIIAISGLHLGLIYVALNYLLSFIPFLKHKRVLQAVLIVAFLWGFSLLTGASASVLRSAVMFTCIVTGKAMDRKMPIYNALAASACLLLCYQPYFLWDVGFQLSYLAVIGIVWVQKPLQQLVFFKQKALRLLWEMFCVTLAAQVFTTPVCLYYFHQFPNLFFLSNLLAVPLSTLILFAALLLLLVSPFAPLALLTGKLVAWGIMFMNEFIGAVAKIPFALTDHIMAGLTGTFLLYLFLFFAINGWLYQVKRWLYISGGCILLQTSITAYNKVAIRNQSKLLIYQTPSAVAIDFIYGRRVMHYSAIEANKKQQLYQYVLRPARLFFGSTKEMPLLGFNHSVPLVWSFQQKKLVVISQSNCYEPLQQKIKINILLLTGNPTVKLEELLDVFEPDIVVMDASNSLWKIAKWQKACDSLHLPSFSIAEEGAFCCHIKS